MSHLIVTMPEGVVQGPRDRRFPQVGAFLGLPYAAPPVGYLRFAPPEPCPRSDAWSPLGAARPARRGSVGAAFAEATRLVLDVWAPEDAHDRPVLFWLHDVAAGASVAGRHRFAARLAAEHGLVVVAPDHRRGALGYLDLTSVGPGLGNGNFGLLDQMEALTWVATHIRAFGGDPSAITVAGDGDGAHAAALLAGMPRTGPLVRRLVLPAAATTTPVRTPAAAAVVTAGFLGALGLGPAGVGRLRDVDAGAIARAEARFAEPAGRSGFGLVDHGEFPFGDLPRLLRAAVSPVEVLVGRSDEAGDRSRTRWTVWRCGTGRSTAAGQRRGVDADRVDDVVGAFARTGDPSSLGDPVGAR